MASAHSLLREGQKKGHKANFIHSSLIDWYKTISKFGVSKCNVKKSSMMDIPMAKNCIFLLASLNQLLLEIQGPSYIFTSHNCDSA
jgi:hypothetical protein